MEKVTLVISIKTIGLESKAIEYGYFFNDIIIIDQMTASFEDAQHYFDSNKTFILSCIKRQQNELGLEVMPLDIELNTDASYPIYLESNGKKKAPLFKKVRYQNKEIILKDYVDSLIRENFYNIYLCDKYACDNPEYESLFNGLSLSVLRTIETFGNIDEIKHSPLPDTILNHLKKKKRYYSLVRSLLANTWDIPLHEEEKTFINQRNKDDIYLSYRPPYKDD